MKKRKKKKPDADRRKIESERRGRRSSQTRRRGSSETRRGSSETRRGSSGQEEEARRQEEEARRREEEIVDRGKLKRSKKGPTETEQEDRESKRRGSTRGGRRQTKGPRLYLEQRDKIAKIRYEAAKTFCLKRIAEEGESVEDLVRKQSSRKKMPEGERGARSSCARQEKSERRSGRNEKLKKPKRGH